MAQSLDDANWLFNFVVQDGNGVKGVADLGLSKVPVSYIQPPQERIDNQTVRTHAQSPIDLSKLDGPEHEQVSFKEAAHSFFDQSPEKKVVYRQGVSPSPLVTYATSFVPDKEKALEWKDYVYMQYTTDSEALEHWPNEFKEVVLEYLKTSDHMKININYYPPCPNPDLTIGVGRHTDIGILTTLLQDGIGA
ncbi:hypothetical protein Patl1_20367 [Pistacia atlantica]|uniref:Uncharacterized protein n=1 Tax=Pistacia atlantica TaxID=434234 RepID=A0ACC1BL59_9ROSI|nr:hypothetical protein Patl1_20367 [Pistacia atlantica]